MIYYFIISENQPTFSKLLSKQNAPAKLITLRSLRFFYEHIKPQPNSIYIFTSPKSARLANSSMLCASVGKSTSKELAKHGAKIILESFNSHASGLCEEIFQHKNELKNYQFIYLRPKIAATNIAGFLHNLGLNCQEQIVYENIPITPQICSFNLTATERINKKPDSRIVVFSSPSLVQSAYKFLCAKSHIFKHLFIQNKRINWADSRIRKIHSFHVLRLEFCAICIGSSTQKTAEKLFKYTKICPQASLKSLVDFAVLNYQNTNFC